MIRHMTKRIFALIMKPQNVFGVSTPHLRNHQLNLDSSTCHVTLLLHSRRVFPNNIIYNWEQFTFFLAASTQHAQSTKRVISLCNKRRWSANSMQPRALHYLCTGGEHIRKIIGWSTYTNSQLQGTTAFLFNNFITFYRLIMRKWYNLYS